MTPEKFRNNELGYREWCENHHAGYVINTYHDENRCGLRCAPPRKVSDNRSHGGPRTERVHGAALQ